MYRTVRIDVEKALIVFSPVICKMLGSSKRLNTCCALGVVGESQFVDEVDADQVHVKVVSHH